MFGLGWPAPHRVIPNAATERWCRADGTAKVIPRSINAGSAFLAKLPATTSVLRMQTPRLPLFSPIAPTVGMPASAVDRAACYAGQTALRMTRSHRPGRRLPTWPGGARGTMKTDP